MVDAERIPKLLKAVIHPEEFEPFRGIDGPEALDEKWQTNSAWVLANLSHSAYHSEKKIERLMRTRGATTARSYLERGAQAFLAVWTDRAVLSFRGTNLSANDFLADARFVKKAQGTAAIHRGFLGEIDKLWPRIEPDLDRYTSNLGIPLFVTGHSLGGAMATIAGTRRASMQVITFGEPRVGSNLGAEFQSDRHIRYVNGYDPIPKVPPTWWPFNYEHHGETIELHDRDGPSVVYDHAIVYYAQNLEAVAT